MAHFAGASDSVADLLTDATDGALKAPDTEKKHYPRRDPTAMEGLLEGTGGPTEQFVEKKHVAGRAETLEAGSAGLTTSEAAPFVSSIALPAKPAGHGDLTAQQTAPADLSPAHISTKRMFDDKPCGVESAPAEDAVAKRPRADLDASRVKAALDATAPAATAPAPAPSKRQVEDAQNKRDRVLQADGAEGTPAKFARKHFDGTGNEADAMGSVLAHPASGPRAARPARPAPEPIAPSTAAIAGIASTDVNRVKKLQNSTNVPAAGAGMTSAAINKVAPSHTAKAAPAAGAGATSAAIATVHHGVAPTSGTAAAAAKAMGGGDVSSSLKWDA